MYDLLAVLMLKSGNCTKAMHLVPRPWDFSNPAKWASKQARQALVRLLTSREGQHYITCMKTAAAVM